MGNKKVAFVVDSCCDVPFDDIERYGMYVVPMQVNYSDGSYLDKVTITPQEVYDRLEEEVPKTSTPTPAVVREVLERVVADGYTQAVVVTISSGLSSTYDLLHTVAAEVEGLEVTVVDTKNIGMGAGLVALALARMLRGGATLKELREAAPRIVESTKVFFCVDTLDYLHKGGRIGKVTYAMGSLINIRPVISCNEEGVYYTVTKAKGRKQSLKKAMQAAQEFAEQFPRRVMAVVNGDAAAEAAEVERELRSRIDADAWYLGNVSPALVVHTGPGLIGIGVQGYA